nr:sulfite exporter TauE/SafE family protein [Natronocella acetinitrilica]
MLELVMPPGLPGWVVLVLVLASALTAFVTTSLGIGGGVLLMAIMTLFMPAAVVIPVHGVIQLGSNAGRMALAWQRIRWPVLAAFTVGSVLGVALGAQVLVELRPGWMELILGVFIVWACLGPMPRVSQGSRYKVGLGGAVTSALTLFVGATGPMVAALIRAMGLDRRDHVSTFAACMVVQHGLKIVVFGAVGFAFGPYAGLMVAMILFGVLGTWIGGLVLERMHDRLFHRLLTVVLLLLAGRLIYVGLRDLSAAA